MDKSPERIEPCEASRAYLDTRFEDIEHRLEDGEIDIKQAELLRTEEYEWAVKNIAVPRYDDGE